MGTSKSFAQHPNSPLCGKFLAPRPMVSPTEFSPSTQFPLCDLCFLCATLNPLRVFLAPGAEVFV
jgi:hypothetical protein